MVTGFRDESVQDDENWYLRPSTDDAFPIWEITCQVPVPYRLQRMARAPKSQLLRPEKAPGKTLTRMQRYRFDFGAPARIDTIVFPKASGSIRIISDGVDVIPLQASREYVMTKKSSSKPEKILNCLFVSNKLPSRQPNEDVDSFGHLFSVDSHPTIVQGRKLLVTSICEGAWGPLTPQGRHLHHEYLVTLVGDAPESELEFEAMGWVRAILQLESWFPFSRDSPLGLIVDSALGTLREINLRRSPLYRNSLLPSPWILQFATSSGGSLESILNAMIRSSDRFNQVASRNLQAALGHVDDWLPRPKTPFDFHRLFVADSRFQLEIPKGTETPSDSR